MGYSGSEQETHRKDPFDGTIQGDTTYNDN